MKVRVRFFGSLYIIAGVKVIEMDLKEGDTIGRLVERAVKLCGKAELKKRIFRKNGELGINLFLNEIRCSTDEKIKDGDEISIMSPISGG